MTAFHDKYALTREKRLGTISHYHGTLASLIDDTAGEDISQRIRTFTQATVDDILSAIAALRGLRGAAIVIHGAVGCGAAAGVLAADHDEGARCYSVNLSERDSILGSETPLRGAILRAIDEGAQAVFVVGTPVVAINNDDVSAVLLELADETPVPVLHVNTDGFKSKSPLSGFDAAFHALLRRVDEPEGDSEDFVNLLAVRESARDIAAVTDILTALGLRWNLLPRFASIDNIRRAGRARATVSLNDDESGYLALGLESVFGVPWLRAPAPIGADAIAHFVRSLGAVFGIEERAETYLASQGESLQEVLAAHPLAGKRLFLQTDTALVTGLAGLVRELGGEVAGLALGSVDLDNRARLERLRPEVDGDIPVVVAAGQPFEIANVLARLPVDYYVGQEQVAFAVRHGATPVSLRRVVHYGFEGIRTFAHAFGGGLPAIREQVRNPYSESWLKKTGSWHVKREVR